MGLGGGRETVPRGLGGLPPGPEIIGHLAMKGMPAGAARLEGRYGLLVDPGTVDARWLSWVEERYQGRVALKPGALGVLRPLRAVSACVSVAVSQERASFVVAYKCTDALELFDEIAAGLEVTVSGKAMSVVYLYAVGLLGILPSEYTKFEDVAAAADALCSAGFAMGGITNPVQQQDRTRLVAVCDTFFEEFEVLDAGSSNRLKCAQRRARGRKEEVSELRHDTGRRHRRARRCRRAKAVH